MKIENRIIKNSYMQRKTDLPLFTETYHIMDSKEDDFHAHEFFEIGLSLEGEGLHQTGIDTQILNRGDVYLIPIGKSHSVIAPISWRVQNIYFLPRLVYQNLSIVGFPNPLFNQFLLTLLQKEFKSIVHIKLSELAVSAIEGLLTALQKASLSNKQLQENYRSNCLLNILMIVCDSYYAKYPSDLLSADRRIPSLLAIIQENIELPSGDLINLISSQMHLHPQYINKLIKSAFSTTFTKLILETKIEKSCEYLLSHYSVTEAAHSLSFYDHAHFNKTFMNYFGISPTAYKEKYSKV